MSNDGTGLGPLYAAMARAQGAFQRIQKDKTARVRSKKGDSASYSYTYADLADVLDSVRRALAENELAFVQLLGTADGGGTVLTTRIGHASGAHIESSWQVPFGSAIAPQDAGIAITYARRYAALAILGVHPDDEDSDAAEIGPAREHRDERQPASPETADDVPPKNFGAVLAAVAAAHSLSELNAAVAPAKPYPRGSRWREEVEQAWRSRRAQLAAREGEAA